MQGTTITDFIKAYSSINQPATPRFEKDTAVSGRNSEGNTDSYNYSFNSIYCGLINRRTFY